MEIFDQAVSIMEGGVEIAKRIKLSETNRPYIPSEAVPKSLGELTSEQWCARNYALYYLFDIREQSNIQTTKHYSEQNRMDMENKVKILLKEVRKDANKAMQLESVRLFSNAGYILESGQPPRNIKQVYQIMAYESTRAECWENPSEFWGKMFSIFHKSTNSEHEGFLAERLIATMDRFGLEIEPYERGNLKHAMWIYVNRGVSGFYKTLYRHEMKTLHCSYRVSGTFKPETDIRLPWQNSQRPKNAGYLRFCKEKFKDGIPTIEQMQQPVHLREIVSAARHAKQYGMKEREFINFAAEAFAVADSGNKNIGKLPINANENPKHDLAARNDTTRKDVIEETRFVSSESKRGRKSEQLEADEESVASIHSIIMSDYSDLNDYERDALNAAFEKIDSLDDKREVGLNTTIGHDRCVDHSSNCIGYFGEVQANQENGGETLKSKREYLKEIGMKMSTGDDRFGVQGGRCVDPLSNRIGYFGEVQANQENGGETLKSKRDDSKQVVMNMSTGASHKRAGDFVDKNKQQQIQQISPTGNNKHCENLKKPISFIHPMNWKTKKETDKKQEKNFESIPDQIKKRQKIVKGRKKCVSKIV